MNEPAVTRASFGGFSVGGIALALPMSALREVVQLSDLTDLPCPAPCVLGGIDVRGMVIPVIDLRVVLGRPAPPGAARSVMIIAHEKKIMGLLTESVTGIFEAVAGSYTRLSVSDCAAAVFLATVQRADNGALISVLSAQALTQLHQVPTVDDPGPSRADQEAGLVDRDGGQNPVPMLLLECNGIPFAVEATVVHATVSNPALESLELTNGHCLTVIGYAGSKVPAIDVLSLCGFGQLSFERPIQAFVISLPSGYVAFLISAVIDVVQTQAADVQALPAFAVPRPGLCAGALLASALPAGSRGRTGNAVNQYLVLDAVGLQACDEVLSMAQLNIAPVTATAGAPAGSDAATPARNNRSMITYMLETECASPFDQVVEILPYQPGAEIFASSGPMLGLMVNRGRSIPILCLGQMAGEACGTPTAQSRILLVECDGEFIGFAVRKLHSIEEADWEPVMPTVAATHKQGKSFRREPHKLAMFSARVTDRLLPILDLKDIAQALRWAVVKR